MVRLTDAVKTLFSLRALVLMSALLMAVPAVAETRIGVVDVRKALFTSEDAKAFSARLQQDFAGMEEEVRKAQREAKELQDRLQQDAAMMNESERERLNVEFQQKAQEFNQKQQRLEKTLNGRKQDFVSGARAEVEAAVKELMKEHNLDIVLPSETVVHVKPELDLTDQLLEKLNQ